MLEKIGALVGAAGFLQFPQIYHQYLHELKGHISELKYQVALFEQGADLAGKNLTEWIEKFLKSTDPDFVVQGQLLEKMVDRLATFLQANRELEAASNLMKPFVFAKVADRGIVWDTLHQFQWGVSFTTEGIAYGCVGLIFGYVFCRWMRSLLWKFKPLKIKG